MLRAGPGPRSVTAFWSRNDVRVLGTLLSAIALAAPRVHALAQHCDSTISRVGLSALADQPIRAVNVAVLPPAALPSAARAFARLHTATRESTIRRDLLFAPGDLIDSVRVAESMRRIRMLPYVEDAQLVARTCSDSAGVAITVVTRDAWSEQPIVAVRPRSVALGLSESNALGSGIFARLTLQSDLQGLGGGASIHDPALWGGRVDGQAGATVYTDGDAWNFALHPRRRTIADAWTADLRGIGSYRDVEHGNGDAFDQARVIMLGGRRLTSELAAHAVYLLVGAEAERASVVWSPLEPLLGRSLVNRRFVGVDVGVHRRSTRYDTLGWVLRHDGIVDVPSGTEGELVTGFGRDGADGREKTHVDGWLGRVWTLNNRSLLVSGLWTSGYLTRESLEAGAARASMVSVTPAANGAWVLRMAAEQLFNPDPNVRALASIDPIGVMLPRWAWLASAAGSASLERDFRLLDVSRWTELDAALFGGFARRWDSAVGDADAGASIVGLGLRLAPSRTPGATLRVDVGYPVGYRIGMRARPVVALSITPWLTVGRQRDGLQQP
ncbi:MAG TPA: hypothetical protein VJN70_15295 [Gemmatimonadaceae bacterium]|nr:hypothetical protein [Gemmatimonadaceae bacterium]